MQAVTPQELLRWDRPGPRYTSYPTVPMWTSAPGDALAEQALARVRSPAQVYVHVPFCREQCSFCGCNMLVAGRRGIGERYLDALARRLDALPLPAERIPVQRVHLGGGTPTWFSPGELERLWGLLSSRFSPIPGAELSVEADPAVTTHEHLQALDAVGFNRLSLGVQSFDPVVLEAVNRPQPRERVEALMAEARRLGWWGLNLDLMYGLPQQTLERFEADLDAVIALRPDRLAVFGYAHVPWLKRHQRKLDADALPQALDRARLYLAAQRRLGEAGYVPIGLDHFALRGDQLAVAAEAGQLHRNFMGYTTLAEVDMIGVGMSAISEVDGVYWQVAPKLMPWLRAVAGQEPLVERGYALTAQDRLRRAVINELMCNLRVDLRLHAGDWSPAMAQLQPLLDEGFATWDGRVLTVTERGRLLVRNAAMAFDSFLKPADDEGPRYSPDTLMADVVVIGAGISGLAVADGLRDRHQVTVLEAGPKAGGKIRSERVEGMVLEQSANGFLDSEPAALALVERAGLTQQLIQAPAGARYVWLDGRLTPVPTKPQAFLGSSVLGWGGKLRVLGDLVMPAGPDEESVAAFVRRRLGRQVVERLVDPMVTGIYAGMVEELEIEACFPKLKALEREHGGLIRGMRARRADPAVAAGPPGVLTSFTGGLAELPLALARRMEGQVLFGEAVTWLGHDGERWSVRTEDGVVEGDAVVMACPGPQAAELLAAEDRIAAKALREIRYAPVAVVCLAFDRNDCQAVQGVDGGFGVLVPRGTDLGVLGTLFTSSIFPAHAPENRVLIRTLIGGAREPQLAERPDRQLVEAALAANRRMLGALPEPVLTRVFRWRAGIPQYTLGHLHRLAMVAGASERCPGLFITGNHLDGIGVKDRAREAVGVVERVEAWLG